MEPVSKILHTLQGSNVLDVATGSGGFLIGLHAATALLIIAYKPS